MTLNGAIMQLVEIWNNPMCPAIFKPALQKVIETISELEEPCAQEDEWLPVDLEHNQPPLEEWVLVSSEEHVTRDAVVVRNGKKIWYHEGEILEDDRWRYPPEPYHPDRNENRENQTRKEV